MKLSDDGQEGESLNRTLHLPAPVPAAAGNVLTTHGRSNKPVQVEKRKLRGSKAAKAQEKKETANPALGWKQLADAEKAAKVEEKAVKKATKIARRAAAIRKASKKKKTKMKYTERTDKGWLEAHKKPSLKSKEQRQRDGITRSAFRKELHILGFSRSKPFFPIPLWKEQLQPPPGSGKKR